MLVLALQFSKGRGATAGAAELETELDADDPLPHNGRENRADTRSRRRRRTYDDVESE